MANAHLAGLRSACAEDQTIWDIYLVSMVGEYFSASVTKMLAPSSHLVHVFLDAEAGRVVGMTRFINPNTDGVVEIGSTYIAPSIRGTGFNAKMKKLLNEKAPNRPCFCLRLRQGGISGGHSHRAFHGSGTQTRCTTEKHTAQKHGDMDWLRARHRSVWIAQ